jgi:hypothetical protein
MDINEFKPGVKFKLKGDTSIYIIITVRKDGIIAENIKDKYQLKFSFLLKDQMVKVK